MTATAPSIGLDEPLMRRAARLALRGHGSAEPNPLVGCLIVDDRGGILGAGCHRRCGGDHAEINALRQAGPGAEGATMIVTLEPCDHEGRTPPCTEAIVHAGIARVVIGQLDPNPVSGGGARRLRRADIAVEVLGDPVTADLLAPFAHRIETGLPWVVAKWAQTLDGRIATRTGNSRWISTPISRRLVHRERGRIDAILTGIGTVLHDDPRLTARGVRRRRTARRVVIDPDLRLPIESALAHSASTIPVLVACGEGALDAQSIQVDQLTEMGVEVVGFPMEGAVLPPESILRHLADHHDVATVLVEAGPGTLGPLFERGLVDEVWVFVAPLILGDTSARAPVEGLVAPTLSEGVSMRLVDARRRGSDLVLRYRRARAGSPYAPGVNGRSRSM